MAYEQYETVFPCFRIVGPGRTAIREFLESHIPGRYFLSDCAIGDLKKRSKPIKMHKNGVSEGYKILASVIVADKEASTLLTMFLESDPQFGVDEVGLHSVNHFTMTPYLRKVVLHSLSEQRKGWMTADEKRFFEKFVGEDEAFTKLLLPFPWEPYRRIDARRGNNFTLVGYKGTTTHLGRRSYFAH
jgi:hypothetical protein